MTLQKRRPSGTICPDCGEQMFLSRCGVDAHMQRRTRREQIEGRCPGRVYIHEVSGGMECHA